MLILDRRHSPRHHRDFEEKGQVHLAAGRIDSATLCCQVISTLIFQWTDTTWQLPGVDAAPLHQERVYQLRAHDHDVDPGCLTISEVEVLSPRGLRPQPYFS